MFVSSVAIPRYVRVNLLKTSVEEVIASFIQAGYSCVMTPQQAAGREKGTECHLHQVCSICVNLKVAGGGGIIVPTITGLIHVYVEINVFGNIRSFFLIILSQFHREIICQLDVLLELLNQKAFQLEPTSQ